MPNQADLKQKILSEAHKSSYSIHPGGTKSVQRPSTNILVGWNEERHCLFCGLLRHMQQGEGKASEASQTPPTVAGFAMEMG